MNAEQFYDLIVVGAGPAGLTAGIIAAQNGLKTLILEKGTEPGPQPRGESFRSNPFLESLLGIEFFESKCFKSQGHSIYHSPGDQKRFKLYGEKPLYFFEWRDLIDRLLSKADSLDLEIRTNACVESLLFSPSGICSGVVYSDPSNKVMEVKGKAVFACDGHRSVIGKQAHVDYDQLICPMIKCRATIADFDIGKIPDLQFYLIGNGDLSLAPDFPQSVAYMFPVGGKKVELGLMLRMMHGPKMTKTVQMPDNELMLSVWNHLKTDYPGFSSYFDHAEIELEEPTGLSNAKMVDRFIPIPGVVLIGDAAGFIDPFGSSGLYSGMVMASNWVFLIKEMLQSIPSTLAPEAMVEELWSENNVDFLEKRFKSSSIYKKIKASYRLIGIFEWYVFKHLRTAKKINKRWNLISWMMQKT
ncbi:NAD(P)/FAD-dependent oxidoreductase [bacterium]|nr:NAD(P)/FAD-dependent oxidoreductase [bacterium]